MGDRAKGRDKGKAKKKPKAVKPGRRPHELQQQAINPSVRAAS
jgi:hypothetical protein